MIVDSVLSSSLTIKNNLPIVDEIKKDLTVDYIDYDKERIIKKFYKLVDDIVLLPRYYKSDKVKFNYVKEKLTHGDDISIDIKKDFQIRDDKIEVLNQISKHKNGIIKLPTGFGKTVLSVLRIAQLKKKAMIVVDREILLDQWKQSILNITNLPEDDIGIYQGNKSELAKPVVIVMVQTLISKLKQDPYRAISEFYNANFGVTFVDEIHSIIGPDVYSDARLVFFSEYLYGLSATPFRNIDKETDIIKYCFGDIIVERTNDVRPKVIFNLFKNTLPKKTYYYLTQFGNGFNYTKYSNAIFKNADFVNMVLDELLNRYEKTTYKILIPLITIKSIDILIKEINSNTKYSILANDIVKLVSETKDDIDKSKRIILSTVGLISKGFDDADIDTLILPIPVGSSKVFLTQLTGRIMRKKNGKNDFTIIDFVDTEYKQTYNVYNVRSRVYNELNFEILGG